MTKEEITTATATATGSNTPEEEATTEKEETPVNNRVSLVFKRPYILTEFNNYFYNKYGTIKDHRITVIEDLLLNFNETKKIEKKKPYYVEDNRKLKEEKERLLTENNNIKDELKTLRALTEKLKKYDSLKEENIKLLKEVETQELTIDELTKKLEKEEKNSIQVKELTDKVTTETSNRVSELKEILQSKEAEIDKLHSKFNDYNTLKEENIRLLEEVKSKQFTIDELTKNTVKLEEKTDKIKQEYTKELTETTNLYENRITNIISKHDETITELINNHDNKIKEKDKEIQKLNGFVSTYAINFSNYKTKVESLGLLDRIRKKFPEYDSTVKELKP